jgi:error-prone DNA polymerase
VIHIVVQHLENRSDALDRLANDPINIHTARADHVGGLVSARRHGHPRDARIIPKSRDFH